MRKRLGLGLSILALTLVGAIAGPALATEPPAKKAPPSAAVPAKRAAPAAAPPAATPPAAAGSTLRVGVEGAYPPFSEMTGDGLIKGFDIDMANAICAEIKAKCLLVQDSFDAIQNALLARRTDAIVASLSMTDERRQRYAFTDRYYQVPAKFVARKDGAGVPAGFDDAALKGVAIGVEDGTVHASFLTERYGGVARIVRFPSLVEAMTALEKGQVPLVLGDALAIDMDFLKSADGRKYRFVGPDMLDPAWMGDGIGIAVRKEDTELRDRLNKAIAALRADGRYQAIAARYFDFDIYGPNVKARQKVLVGMPFAPRRTLPDLLDGPSGMVRK